MPANSVPLPALRADATAPRRAAWGGPLLLVAAATIAYANSFRGPFVFDDIPSIVDNPTIRHLWPPGDALSPPSGWGHTVSGRPILNLSFALNHAVSGLDVWSYHALNLVIHALAGLTLFGLVRRTCARPCIAARLGPQADALAFAVSLLWLVHPLQTESVTYVVQRAESLMGLFFLATLYAFVRAVDAPRPRAWLVISFVACLLGAGTKEVAAMAPLLVVLYDRTFVSASFRGAWQHHRWFFLALATTWLPLAYLLAGTGGNRGGTVGFDVGVSWSGYWLTQVEAITRYLALTFWPHPLVFDYGKMTAADAAVALPWVLPVTALVVATLLALRRWPVAGFLGAWFFAILAPTSIVPGANQIIVEHRMYLPLAAVVALVCGWMAPYLGRRTFLATIGALGLLATGSTLQRNADYADEQRLWAITLVARPQNSRAHNNLGRLLHERQQYVEAITCYRSAVRLDPTVAQTHFNLGLALLRSGSTAEAAASFAEAVRIRPDFPDGQLNLGIALASSDRLAEAVPHFAAAVRLDPGNAAAQLNLGTSLAQLGRTTEAIEPLRYAVRLRPDDATARYNLGTVLFGTGQLSEARAELEASLRIAPDFDAARQMLRRVQEASASASPP